MKISQWLIVLELIAQALKLIKEHSDVSTDAPNGPSA